MFLYVFQPVERVLASAIRNKFISLSPTIRILLYVALRVERFIETDLVIYVFDFQSKCRHISLCNPASYARQHPPMETINFGSILSIGIFLYLAQPVENLLDTAFEKSYTCSSHTIGVFLYVAEPVKRVIATNFKTNFFGSRTTIGIHPYVDQSDERVLQREFANIPALFDSP